MQVKLNDVCSCLTLSQRTSILVWLSSTLLSTVSFQLRYTLLAALLTSPSPSLLNFFTVLPIPVDSSSSVLGRFSPSCLSTLTFFSSSTSESFNNFFALTRSSTTTTPFKECRLLCTFFTSCFCCLNTDGLLLGVRIRNLSMSRNTAARPQQTLGYLKLGQDGWINVMHDVRRGRRKACSRRSRKDWWQGHCRAAAVYACLLYPTHPSTHQATPTSSTDPTQAFFTQNCRLCENAMLRDEYYQIQIKMIGVWLVVTKW